MIENVIIIGGGPAGLAASIYNARAGLKPLVIAGSPPGGQLTLTSEVENYPGFDSILGPELILKMRKHAEKFGVRFVDENVIGIDTNLTNETNGSNLTNVIHRVSTPSVSYDSKAVIITTGAKALWLNLPSEQRLRGKGVSACATCDAFFFKNKTVAVVGGGDTAMEEALTLTKFVNKVYIIHRRHEFRASKIMQDRVLKHPKIEIIWDSEVVEVLGEKKVEAIKFKIINNGSLIVEKKLPAQVHHLTSNIYQLKLDGVFIAIGHKPDTEIFNDKLILDKKGYIVTAERMAFENLKSQITNNKSISNFKFQNSNYRSATSVEGVFAAGDCVDHEYKQAATAVGMGVAAALEVEKYLTEL